eukprot:830997-Prorocentrum_minimum.AAC.2
MRGKHIQKWTSNVRGGKHSICRAIGNHTVMNTNNFGRTSRLMILFKLPIFTTLNEHFKPAFMCSVNCAFFQARLGLA